MGGDSEYEPKDSRNVTGEAATKDGRWSGDPQPKGHGGEYEPRDSRNVTGTASTPDGRWTNKSGKAPPGVPDGNPIDARDAADRPGRDDTLEPELERERLEPGMDSEGAGGAGANPDSHREDSNSNT